MKKSCNGCKALDYQLDSCTLGYRTDSRRINVAAQPGSHIKATVGELFPTQECPKPLTNKRYNNLFLSKASVKQSLHIAALEIETAKQG